MQEVEYVRASGTCVQLLLETRTAGSGCSSAESHMGLSPSSQQFLPSGNDYSAHNTSQLPPATGQQTHRYSRGSPDPSRQVRVTSTKVSR